MTQQSQAPPSAVPGSWQCTGLCGVHSEMGLGDAEGRALADADVFPQLAPPQPWVYTPLKGTQEVPETGFNLHCPSFYHFQNINSVELLVVGMKSGQK